MRPLAGRGIVTEANRDPLCGTDWGRLLNDEFAQPYWGDLMTFVEEERALRLDSVYPHANEVFRALELTWCEQTKVVIVGQDPYYKQPGQAHGLCFSVPCGVRRPQSLVRIHTELRTDVRVRTPGHGSLVLWAHRGALLLNTTLTVSAGAPLSHRGRGWERFTDKVIEVVARERDPVFLLMGEKAKQKAHGEGAPIKSPANVIEAPHPVHPTFPGSEPFSRVNLRLRELGRDEFDWSLEP
jgi:uracil-DNA glycosylase